MNGRLVVLGQIAGRPAAALVVDGRLQDLLLSPPDDIAGFAPGAILRGVVDRPMKGQGGVFVRLPEGRRGFLRDAGGLAPGRAVLCQVTGWGEAEKATPVTLRLIFKSRLSIVTPQAPGLNVSRRIADADTRRRLADLAETVMQDCGFGLILRSAAADADDHALSDDIAAMRTLAERVMADTDGAPELLLDAPDPHEEAWRDWADPPPDAVAEGAAAMAEHGVDDMVAALADPRVALSGGGHMTVEPTRAFVAVDVNTGGDTSPASALKANIAAARDLPRQLRLRGLGGQVIVGFAPVAKKDRVALEQQLRAAFRGEAAETVLAGWTALGNFEIQRKRDRVPTARLLGWRR